MRHVDPLGIGVSAKAGLDDGRRLRVLDQAHARGFGRAGPRMVVGRCADSAKAENNVVPCHRLLQGGRDALGVVAQVLTPVELQTAVAERFHGVGKVAVAALAAQELGADDDQPDATDVAAVHEVSTAGSPMPPGKWRPLSRSAALS